MREIQRQTGYNRLVIRDCCEHKTKQSHEYRWEHLSQDEKNTEIKGDRGI